MGASASVPKVTQNLTTRDQKRRVIRKAIDNHGFRWLIFEVAATGFFTDSYNLFATNVILPSLSFVYWPNGEDWWRDTLINCMTLVGSIIGQTRLYGIELLIVIFSTVCLAGASDGAHGSMDIFPWLVSMRTLMGVGIGAEYPLSAAICAEWASTQARGLMMTAVFMMQPLGQLLAQVVGLAVLTSFNSDGHLDDCMLSTDQNQVCGRDVDRIWRWVAGVGAIPALVAIAYRFRLNDPGLYDLDVKNEGERAVQNTMHVYSRLPADFSDEEPAVEMGLMGDNASEETGGGMEPEPPLPVQFSKEDIHDYFFVQGNWRYVAGTSLCWFLLDVAFYGLGMGSPSTIAKLWAYVEPQSRGNTTSVTVPLWNPDPLQPNRGIGEVLRTNAFQNLMTVGIGSLMGCMVLSLIINYVPRKQFLTYSFFWLAVLFFITGASFPYVFHNDMHAVSIVLIAFCHFSFNLGPNTLTFIIPAEVFPTRYRCTCHGIAAAAGKLGSVIVQAILPSLNKMSNHEPPEKDDGGLRITFIIFGFVMALGAIFAFAWIPAVQVPRSPNGGLRLPSKTLEELGEGIQEARRNGEVIGMRAHFGQVTLPFRRTMGTLRGTLTRDTAST